MSTVSPFTNDWSGPLQVTRYDGRFRGERFQDSPRQPFVPTRQDYHVTGAVDCWHLVVRNVTQKLDQLTIGVGFQLRPKRAVTDDGQLRAQLVGKPRNLLDASRGYFIL